MADTREDDILSQDLLPEAIFSLRHPASAAGLVAPLLIQKALLLKAAFGFHFEGALPESAKADDHTVSLIHGALYALIGVNKRIQGVREVEGRDWTTLIDVAPAVWNFHYLQVCTPLHMT